MEVNLATFSIRQQQALLDLLILARYADGNLSTATDEQLQKILVTMGHTDEIQRQREFDSAVTRMHPFVQSTRQAKEKVLALADMFYPRIQQRQVTASMLGRLETQRLPVTAGIAIPFVATIIT